MAEVLIAAYWNPKYQFWWVIRRENKIWTGTRYDKPSAQLEWAQRRWISKPPIDEIEAGELVNRTLEWIMGEFDG